jgi:hypothetical protein
MKPCCSALCWVSGTRYLCRLNQIQLEKAPCYFGRITRTGNPNTGGQKRAEILQ